MYKFKTVFLAVAMTILCVIAAPVYLLAQTSDTTLTQRATPRNVIAIVPQYAFYNGFRIDYERNIKHSDNWIVMAPQFYIDNDPRYYYSTSYESLAGIGINLYYKSIVYKSARRNRNNDLSRHALYVSAGPNFQYFNLKNTEEVARAFTDNGITYFQFVVEDVEKKIYRVGAIANMGWQMAFDRFLLDLYLGVAFKYSMDENGKMIESDYADWVDPAYSGILLDGGLRIGLFF